ncbi:hypothetical protein QBC33DRAFT_4287 [Phialemonium atrogriseum]|uniref:Uncharacterized protein n=1 Tax=Phialemonium atrogriseum TaxID=1093897 RepID=A0AAJ0CDF7_9PEZI|nr:uncharacterized protein QBC33DRAFT_4287 [Phialemonium atrogriseum]KAK1772296.1 hypothetical protein QBC33DRAFT_4287 [Phialemonium atrogriseum]
MFWCLFIQMVLNPPLYGTVTRREWKEKRQRGKENSLRHMAIEEDIPPLHSRRGQEKETGGNEMGAGEKENIKKREEKKLFVCIEELNGRPFLQSSDSVASSQLRHLGNLLVQPNVRGKGVKDLSGIWSYMACYLVSKPGLMGGIGLV